MNERQAQMVDDAVGAFRQMVEKRGLLERSRCEFTDEVLAVDKLLYAAWQATRVRECHGVGT